MMGENLLNNKQKTQDDVKENYVSKKIFTILIMAILLLIPIALMNDIIGDRESYRRQVIDNIAQSWANKQTIYTPVMSFCTKNKKNETVTKELELNTYKTEIFIKTEIRKKGIFKVPVYTADVIQKGDFNNNYGNLKGKQLSTKIRVSDARGFIKEPIFKINNDVPVNVQDDTCTFNLNTNAEKIPFEITYKIRGLNEISVLLKGRKNNVTICGDWKNPEFKGAFSPNERKITNKDFKATWSIPKIALSYKNQLNSKGNRSEYGYGYRCLPSNNDISDITVSLLAPVDNYSMCSRSLQYGFFLLCLTFIGYFIFEITSNEKRKIHPFQYSLLGGTILIFYLLLVSISEILSFNVAYLISTIMIMSLIFAYTYFVITKKESLNFSIGITLSTGLLYVFFYILLISRYLALFVGSFGLFVIIAIIMYFTRNVNWYIEKQK